MNRNPSERAGRAASTSPAFSPSPEFVPSPEMVSSPEGALAGAGAHPATDRLDIPWDDPDAPLEVDSSPQQQGWPSPGPDFSSTFAEQAYWPPRVPEPDSLPPLAAHDPGGETDLRWAPFAPSSDQRAEADVYVTGMETAFSDEERALSSLLISHRGGTLEVLEALGPDAPPPVSEADVTGDPAPATPSEQTPSVFGDFFARRPGHVGAPRAAREAEGAASDQPAAGPAGARPERAPETSEVTLWTTAAHAAAPSGPAAHAAAAANRDESPDPLEWPPVPTDLFPLMPDEPGDFGPPGDRSVDRFTAHARSFISPTGGTAALGVRFGANGGLAAQASTLVGLIPERWSQASVPTIASLRDDAADGDLGDVQSPMLTVLFALLAIAGVLLFVYLVTPLLR